MGGEGRAGKYVDATHGMVWMFEYFLEITNFQISFYHLSHPHPHILEKNKKKQKKKQQIRV